MSDLIHSTNDLGGEVVERMIPGLGELRFENFAPGQWRTQKGEPAKIARRRYLLNGDVLDAVSDFCRCLDKPAMTKPNGWIERMAAIGAVQAERMGELAGVPEEDWSKRMRLLNLGPTAKKEEGADRGTIIHSVFEALAAGKPVPNPSEFPALARPWLRGAIAAWQALDVTEVVAAETMVCHPELGYGGRPDLVAVADGLLTLLDYKSGKGYAYPEAHYQTRLYDMGLRASADIEVDRVVIVAVGDDGAFDLPKCDATELDARALIHVYRSRKRIESKSQARWRAAKALAATA